MLVALPVLNVGSEQWGRSRRGSPLPAFTGAGGVQTAKASRKQSSLSGRKRRPPSLLDGGILWFFSNCGASVGFLTRYDGVLREPLVWLQGSHSLPLGLALGSPIFPSGCEGKLGVALESLQGLRDLT